MTATAPPPPLAPAEALRAMASALRFEAALRSRTEGLTWTIWGLVTAGIFLSYDAVNPLFYGPHAPFRATDDLAAQTSPWWTGGLWVPWILLGALITYALWRSASLSSPAARPGARHALFVVGFVVFLFAGWGAALLVAPDRNFDAYPLLGVGTAWLLLGLTNVHRATPTGRRTVVTMGVAIFGLGVAVLLLLPTDWHDAWTQTGGLIAALVTGSVPIAGGMYQALRG